MTVSEKRRKSEKRFALLFFIFAAVITCFVLRYADRVQNRFIETGYLILNDESK